MRITTLAAVVALSVALCGPALAQSATPSPSASPAGAPGASPSPIEQLAHDRIDAMWKTGPQEAWFSAVFLTAIPLAQVTPILAAVRTALGAYRSTTGSAGRYTSTFEKGTQDVRIHFDAAGKIDGLFLPPPRVALVHGDDGLQRLRDFPGTVGFAIIEGRSHRAAFNASRPLAIGSAFKLALLAALQDRIARGDLQWSDVAPLDPRWKSLPSGVLQDWPDGTPITLATYAAEMISISDNTAADAVAALAGDAAITPYAGHEAPLLTTRELFALRAPANAALAAQWAAADARGRTELRAAVTALPLPTLDSSGAGGAGAGDLRVEWHFSPDELCALMARDANLPAMSINPGLADRSDFRHVAFKGGSEPGVLALVTQVTTHAGHTVCIAAAVNDPTGVDGTAFETAYRSVLANIAAR